MSDFNSSLPIRTQTNGDAVIEICDGTTTTQKLAVSSAGSAQVAGQGVAGTPAGGVVSVQGVSGGTAIPISGTVTATNPSVSTTGAAVPASATFVGGQVTTAAPTYVTGNLSALSLNLSGGLRVDGSGVTQPISGSVSVTGTVAENLTQVGGSAIALGQTTMSASLPVAIASNQGALASNITQVAGSTVSASNPLGVQISTGSAYISATNPLPVVIDPAGAGTPVDDPKAASAISVGATDNHQYTVTAAKTFHLLQILASASGKFKAVVGIETGVGSGTFTTKFVFFSSTAEPNQIIPVVSGLIVAAGVKVQVALTNLDLAAQDLYSTISGFEV